MRLLVTLCGILCFTPQVAGQQSVPTWSLSPELRIGSIDQDHYDLTPIRGLAVSPRTGAVFVTQGHEIRVFDQNGRYIRTIGRRGDGPGENRGLGRLNWTGEALAAFDSDLAGRATLVTEDGTVIEARAITISEPARGSRGSPRAALRGGYYLWESSPSDELWLSEHPIHVPLVRTDGRGDDVVLDQLNRGHGWQIYPFMGRQLLAGESLFSTDPAGSTIVIAHQRPPVGRDDAWFRIRRLDAEGAVVFARSYSFEPTAVPEEFSDSLVSAHFRRMRVQIGDRNLESRIREVLRIPRYQPPLTDLVVGADGSVWLRREDTRTTTVTWWVLDSQGDLVGQLSLPPRHRILHVDADTVWGMEFDDLDVPYAVRYSLQR